MKRFDTNIGSRDTALEKAPEVVKSVGVDTSVNLLMA
jgi:hypothetical protein